MIVIGFDVGTTRCKAAYLDETGRPQIALNRRGDAYTPSAVFFERGCNAIVGLEAVAEGFLHPELVHTCFKRILGAKDVLHTDPAGKTYTATELTSFMIRSLKEDIERRFNEEADQAVIAVPANFQDHKKQATIDAAKMAGMAVLKLVHEPTAAGIAYAIDRQRDQRMLIYDLGGGTFDVSVLECSGNAITVLNTSGRERLGGMDFNARIERFIVEQFKNENRYEPTPHTDPLFFQELAEKSEQAKLALSEKSKTRVVIGCRGKQAIVEITREQFEALTADLLKETLDCTEKAVAESGLTWKKIDTVVLVGGSVRMPAVTAALADLSGIVPHCDVEPDRAVAYGAALECGIELSKAGKTITIGGRAIPASKAFVQEVTAYGVGCCVTAKDGTLTNAVILPKSTPIPTTKTDRFALQYETQTEARIEVLQGEEGQPRSECLSIGEIVLKNLPAEHMRSKRIEVTYDIDANGMIRATGRDSISGQQVEIRVDYRKGTTGSHMKNTAA